MKRESRTVSNWLLALPLSLLVLVVILAGCGGPTATPVPASSGTPTPTSLVIRDSNLPPIVLVHGYKGATFSLDRTGCPATPTPRPVDWSDFKGFEQFILDNNIKVAGVYRVGLISSSCYTAPITVNARLLKNEIKRIREESKSDKVILICHSMGGLVGRLYVESDLYTDGDVSYLITIGSPHVGVNLTSRMLLSLLAPSAMKLYAFEAQQKVMNDFVVGAMKKQAPRRNNTVKYEVIDGIPDLINFTPKGALIQFLAGFSPTDGLVPSYSGDLLAMEDKNTPIHVVRKHDAHSSDLGNPDYFSDKGEAMTVLKDILKSMSTAVPGTPTPAPTQVAVRPLPATPQPPCKADEFLDLLKPAESELENHVADVAAQFSIECKGESGTSLSELTEGAVNNGISLNLRSIHGSADATGLLVTTRADNSLSAGVLENGEPVENIPGSRVIQDQDSIYVLYSAVEVTTTITNAGASLEKLNIQVVSGNSPQTLFVEKRELEVQPNEIARISPGRNPTVEFLDRNTLRLKRNVRFLDIPRIPGFVDRIRPQDVIPNTPNLPLDEKAFYPEVDLQPDFGQ